MYRATLLKMGVTLTLCLGLSACLKPQAGTGVTRADFGDEEIITDFTLGPPGAKPGACYGKDVTPGVVEQITENKLIEPAKMGENGNILSPAKYETITTSRIVEGRDPIYFEVPCPPRWTPDFIASVQRALSARGLYDGAASGTLDPETRKAIRTFQISNGLNSAILSIDSARALGLVEIDLS